MNIRTLTLLALVVPALALAGCAAENESTGDDPDATPTPTGQTTQRTPPEVRIVARDYSFDAPATMPSGPVRIVMENLGPDAHHVGLYRFEAGKGLDDVFAHYADGPADIPAWLTSVGGPNVPPPGETSNAYLDLEPGEYVIICVIPALDHVQHVAKGMARGITVTDEDTGAKMPEPDVVITLEDFDFALEGTLVAGENVVRVVNMGPHIHEAVLFELFGDATTMDFITWMESPQGPPPGRTVGGVTPIHSGLEATFSVDLTPGRYTLVCFETDGTQGAPHFLHEMIHEFEVR